MMSQYDVYESMSKDSKRPTARQREVINLIREGHELEGHFDVWGGYWWTQQGYGVHRRTVQGLLDRRLVERLPNERVYSGRQRIPFRLSNHREDGKVK